MKRHLSDLYGFTEQQLFGPSRFRNGGDLRYPKQSFHDCGLVKVNPEELDEILTSLVGPVDRDLSYWKYDGRTEPEGPKMAYLPKKLGSATILVAEGDPRFWLSPREALQKYGELMNNLYLDSWVRKGIDIHRKIATGEYLYSKMGGLMRDSSFVGPGPDTVITCFSDFRHVHEVRAARRSKDDGVTPILIRIRSKRVPHPPFDHRSEMEQVSIPDSDFNFVVHNDGSVEDLHEAVDSIVSSGFLSGTINPTIMFLGAGK
jgi:hypothetical protein